ncbi:MAG TPA: metallopeptidase TldD-related protein [Candidatus Caenarcaniphilales bacterium]
MRQPSTEELELVFNQLSDLLINQLQADEHLWIELASEQSHFIRFNAATVRQSGTITDGTIKLRFIHNQRRAYAAFPFTGDLAVDSAAGLENISYLRGEVTQLPEDPYIVLPQNNGSSREVYQGTLLAPEQATEAILPVVQNVDFTGIYASGGIIRANFNSAGQKDWFASDSFCLDYSMIAPSQKAVKATLAGNHWSQKEYQDQIEHAKTQLQALDLPVKTIRRGQYRTYFTPAATAELVDMLARGAISEAALRQGGSALGKLRDHNKQLSPLLNLKENFSRGVAPRFNEFGEVAPVELPLIVKGELVNTLVNARTAKEYNVPSNGANSSEFLRCPEVGTGTLKSQEILKQLGTGLYLSNLHYLNWSDRAGGCITGMTRYACFWVKDGEIIAPIEDLRFDESLYTFFGQNLEAFTDFQDFIPDTTTYGTRQLGGALMPGMVVGDFTFTL